MKLSEKYVGQDFFYPKFQAKYFALFSKDLLTALERFVMAKQYKYYCYDL